MSVTKVEARKGVFHGFNTSVLKVISLTSSDQKPYDLLAIQAITRNGLQPYTSPADQLITDLHVRGVSVDQLYLMLASMEAWQCMAILESYGERENLSLLN